LINPIISYYTDDEFVKSPFGPVFVIPAKAGIQFFQWVLDSDFHWSDGLRVFYEIITDGILAKKDEVQLGICNL
jgi:hypothetical protein